MTAGVISGARLGGRERQAGPRSRGRPWGLAPAAGEASAALVAAKRASIEVGPPAANGAAVAPGSPGTGRVVRAGPAR